jgi:hypothetical protein
MSSLLDALRRWWVDSDEAVDQELVDQIKSLERHCLLDGRTLSVRTLDDSTVVIECEPRNDTPDEELLRDLERWLRELDASPGRVAVDGDPMSLESIKATLELAELKKTIWMETARLRRKISERA